jgi:hypothetical protein
MENLGSGINIPDPQHWEYVTYDQKYKESNTRVVEGGGDSLLIQVTEEQFKMCLIRCLGAILSALKLEKNARVKFPHQSSVKYNASTTFPTKTGDNNCDCNYSTIMTMHA